MPGYSNLLTFARSSAADYTDSAGETQTAAADEARFEWSSGSVVGLAVQRAAGSRAVERLSGAIGSWHKTSGFSHEIRARTSSYVQDQVLFQLDDGSESNRIRIVREHDGAIHLIVTNSGNNDLDIESLDEISDSTDFTVRFRVGDDFAICVDDGTVYTGSASVPSGLTTIRAGGSTPSAESNAVFDDDTNWLLDDDSQLVFLTDSDLTWDGYIKSASYHPEEFTDAQLKGTL